MNIFNALVRNLSLDIMFDKRLFIQMCPNSLSGADLYALTNKARKHALKRYIAKFEMFENYKIDEEVIFLNEEDFNFALEGFQPTLTEDSFREYQKYFKKYLNKK